MNLSLNTIITVIQIFSFVVATASVVIALYSYLRNNALKRVMFINQQYNKLAEKDMFEFYNSLMQNKVINIVKNSKEEYMLTKLLTIFDNIANYYDRNILDDISVSYIACEILDIYNHPTVKDYVNNIFTAYKEKGYSEDIIPYTGISYLGKILYKKYVKF